MTVAPKPAICSYYGVRGTTYGNAATGFRYSEQHQRALRCESTGAAADHGAVAAGRSPRGDTAAAEPRMVSGGRYGARAPRRARLPPASGRLRLSLLPRPRP